MGFDKNLLMVVIPFWSAAVNAFVLPSGMFSSTLMDIAVILGLSASAVDSPTLYPDQEKAEFSMNFNKKMVVHANFVPANMGDSAKVSHDERGAFLLHWICKYLLCSTSFGIVFEYSYYVSQILRDRLDRPISLASLIISLLYQGLNRPLAALAAGEDASIITAPFLVLQLWLYQYFPNFGVNWLEEEDDGKAEEVTGYRLRKFPVNQLSSLEIFEQLYSKAAANADSFSYAMRDEGPGWLWLSIADATFEELRSHWAGLLCTRPLFNDIRPTARYNKISAEPYYPQCCARQFSLMQGVLADPSLKLQLPPIVRPKLIKAEITVESIKFGRKLATFFYQDFRPYPMTTSSFNRWWSEMKAIYFSR